MDNFVALQDQTRKNCRACCHYCRGEIKMANNERLNKSVGEIFGGKGNCKKIEEDTSLGGVTPCH